MRKMDGMLMNSKGGYSKISVRNDAGGRRKAVPTGKQILNESIQKEVS